VGVDAGVAGWGADVGAPSGGVDVGVGDTVDDGVAVAVLVGKTGGGGGGVAVGGAPGRGSFCCPTTMAPHGPGSTIGLCCAVELAPAPLAARRPWRTTSSVQATTTARRCEYLPCISCNVL
jgi:hypothetical protein